MSFLEATASELSLVKGEMLIQTIEFVVCNKAVKKIHGLLCVPDCYVRLQEMWYKDYSHVVTPEP